MKNKILKILSLAVLLILVSGIANFAAQLDPSIPSFDANALSLTSDGTARFVAPAYAGEFKRYDIQLLKRVTVASGSNLVYVYKTSGTIKYADVNETEYTFNISSIGYYQFQIRGENLEGNYGAWSAIYDNSIWASNKLAYPGVAVTEDDISAGGNSSSGIGSGSIYSYGPGVVQYGYYPYTNQYWVIGPNGEIIYNYAGNQSNNFYTNQQYAASAMAQGPGYVNNYAGANSALTPYTGISSYPVAPSPYSSGTTTSSGAAISSGNGQTNPNYSGATTNYSGTVNSNATPQITQGLESGWHVDNNGRFFYQGNGVVLKGTWYLIDGAYYRFSNNGYALTNQWFRDSQTGYWYFLSADGRMVTGWQKINGAWYYFKPENGNGYGAMFANTSIEINDPAWGHGIYAFDANGASIMNAWFGGYYYGSDGKRAR
ncbi:MAG: hypothetical protein IJ790_01090 [Lachnospiraceae bacterium]|nr:hypothetical protein [Lachnospiraceae bacterium]MBR1844307.1 hypothetical protein [Lachnospiraceae bacterium]